MFNLFEPSQSLIASPTGSANTHEKNTGHRSINAPYHVFVLAEGIRSSATQRASAEDDSSVPRIPALETVG